MSTRVSGAAAAVPFVRLDDLLARLTRPLAVIGVGGMLAAAIATVIDVLLRWSLGVGFTALNEVTAMVFAISIAAVLPAGVARRVNLKIDISARWLSSSMRLWLDAIGDGLLLLFFAVLAWQVGLYAAGMQQVGRTSAILEWPLAPAFFAVTALLTIAAIIQTGVLVGSLSGLGSRQDRGTPASAVVKAIACALAAGVVSIAVAGAYDFAALAGFAQDNVGFTVTCAFILMWILMLGLVPLSTVTSLIGLFGAALFLGWAPALGAFGSEATGLLTNNQIATLPLFLMMGSFAAVSGMADDLYRLAHVAFGRFRGGLAYATIGSCAGFGALTGSSLATAATIGRVAIPEMQSRGYSPALATGTCAAGGTLGPLVPPGSGPLIVFALLTEASVGQLFVASVGPAVLAVAFYFIAIALYVRIAPRSAPAATATVVPGELGAALKRCIPVGLLVLAVMGGLYLGIFTDTESAAVGAIGAFLCVIFRKKLDRESFAIVLAETTATTAMIYGLIIGAQVFSVFVSVSGLTEWIGSAVAALDLNYLVLLIVILAGYLLLGAVMDSMAMMIITVPIITPLILGMGYDIVWWGVVMLCVVETGLITPPLGLNVYVLKSISPDISLETIFKGVLPFLVADLCKLALLVAFPAIALYLVRLMAS